MNLVAQRNLVLAVVVILTFNPSLDAQRVRRDPPAGGLVSLALRQNVRKELGLDLEQQKIDDIEKLGKEIVEERQNELRKQRQQGQLAPDGQLKPEIRSEVVRIIKEKYEPKLKAILSDEQYKRLKQISWHGDLADALADQEVIDALDLTADQTKRISELTVEFQNKHREQQIQGQDDAQKQGLKSTGPELNEKLGKIWKERDQRLLEVLSKQQQKRFEKLKGAPLGT